MHEAGLGGGHIAKRVARLEVLIEQVGTPAVGPQPTVQALYTVAPQTGNDTTGNGSALRPYKTLAKVFALLALASAPFLTTTIPQNTAVQINVTQAQLDTTDPLFIPSIAIPGSSTVTIQGTFIRERTAATTAVQNHVDGGNLFYEMTGDFTGADVGKVVRFGSPQNVCHVIESLGGNQVRVTQPIQAGAGITKANLVNLAPYEVGQYTALAVGGVGAVVQDNSSFGLGTLAIQDFEWSGFGAFAAPVIGPNVLVRECTFDPTGFCFVSFTGTPTGTGSGGFLINTYAGGGWYSSPTSGLGVLGGCMVLGGFPNHVGGALNIDGNFEAVGPGSLIIDSPGEHAVIASVAGSGGAQFIVTAGCKIIFENLFYGTSFIWGLWGAGGAGAFSIEGNAAFINNSGVLTTQIPIVGATVLFQAGTTTCPAFDASLLPAAPYTALRTLSIANIAAAVGAGGFSGSAFDPRSGCYFGTA